LDDLSTGNVANLDEVRSCIEFIEGDVADTETLARAVSGIEWISHQAAKISVPGSFADPYGYEHTNVYGTMALLQAAVEAGVQRFVMASTCAVYGNAVDLPIRENSPKAPMSPYAATKICDEVFLQTFAISKNIATTALRYFNVYGPRQDPKSEYAAVIPKFIERIRAGLPPRIYGDGTQTRDFVFVGDVARANLCALESAARGFRVFNVAGGQSYSLLELVDALNDALGTQFVPEHVDPREGDIMHSSAWVGCAAEEMGFRAKTLWREGLALTCAAFQ
jgi:UDP-glucose 4-epimerase